MLAGCRGLTNRWSTKRRWRAASLPRGRVPTRRRRPNARRGLRVREYRVPCTGSGHCTVAPDDDVLIARLVAALAGVARLDLVVADECDAAPMRRPDIPFRADAGEVVLVPPIERIRALPASTSRMQLLAVDGGRERVLGEYSFIHRPWTARPG